MKQQRAAVGLRQATRFGYRRGQARGRVVVCAVAEHQVEQDRGHAGIGGLREHGGIAQRRVDHRVRPSAGVFVVTQVEQHMAVEAAVESIRAAGRRVRAAVQPLRQQHQLRFVAEGAAGEERAQPEQYVEPSK